MRMQRCTFKNISWKQSPARAQVSPLERSCNKGTRSSVKYHARAYSKSTVKVLDGWNLRPTPARAWDVTPLERPILRSSVKRNSAERCGMRGFSARAPSSPLERKCKIWEFQIAPPSSKPSLKALKPILLGPFSGKHLKTHRITRFKAQFEKSKPKGV